jgi:hypothetical protein
MALRGRPTQRFLEPQSRSDFLIRSVFALYNRNRTLIMTLGALLVVEQLFLAGSNLVMSLPGVQFSGGWCYPSKVPSVANGLVCVTSHLCLAAGDR